MNRFAFEFTARITILPIGPWKYFVVFLPAEVAAQLPLNENPRLRVRGEIGEFPFSGAWQPLGGRWYLKLSKDFLKKAEAGVGDWLHLRFHIDDQAAVDLPEALAAALESDAAFRQVWEQLSPGKQRSWALPVAGAKTPATIAKRINALKEQLLENQNPSKPAPHPKPARRKDR